MPRPISHNYKFEGKASGGQRPNGKEVWVGSPPVLKGKANLAIRSRQYHWNKQGINVRIPAGHAIERDHVGNNPIKEEQVEWRSYAGHVGRLIAFLLTRHVLDTMKLPYPRRASSLVARSVEETNGAAMQSSHESRGLIFPLLRKISLNTKSALKGQSL